MKILKVVLLATAFGLTGCAAYDESAIPQAEANYAVAYQQCVSEGKSGLLKTATDFNNCVMDAQETVFQTIKFAQMGIFDAYRKRTTMLAADYDAGKINGKELGDGIRATSTDFATEVNQVAQLDAQRRQQAAAALVALSQYAAMQQAYQPPPSRPVQCTSNRMGAFTYTNCQ